MARRSPAEKLQQIQRVTLAWESLAPGSVFYGMTLAQFKEAVRPGLDVRKEITDLEWHLEQLILRRNFADTELMQRVEGVIQGVKGDPKFGQDSALYAAMGYVPKSARRKRRKMRTPSV